MSGKQETIEGGYRYRSTIYLNQPAYRAMRERAEELDVTPSEAMRRLLERGLEIAATEPLQFPRPARWWDDDADVKRPRQVCFVMHEDVADRVKAIAREHYVSFSATVRCLIETATKQLLDAAI